MAERGAAPPTIEIRRTIRAPRKRVFDAWTRKEEIVRWHAPGPLTVSLAEIDLRPGGTFRIHMRSPEGKDYCVSGVYREIDPPGKIVYSWGWDGDHPVKDSTVTVEFHERGDATEVVLTHTGITHDKERTGHTEGWIAILEKFTATYDGAST
jgi:uncharacterized protein YndB with AHSA1/START domain